MRPLLAWDLMDDNATVLSLKREISKFRDARGWLKYDTPRSLAISITIEAAELLEHFQWKNDEQLRELLMQQGMREKISDELADVMIYCLGFSDVLDIDISDAIISKIRKNGEKYPVSKQSLPA